MNKNTISLKWQNFLTKVRDKKFWYTLIAFIGIILVLYAVELTLVSVTTRQRAIIGTALQFFTGFIIGVDQVVANVRFQNSKDIWDFIAKTRMRLSLLICLIISLIAVLYWLAIDKSNEMSIVTVYAGLAALALLYYPYLFWFQLIVKKIEKGRGLEDPATKESSLLWSNVILFGISLIIVLLTGAYVKPLGNWILTIWFALVALLVTPTMVFSFLFLLIVGIICLFSLGRKKVKRSVFWLAMLGLWSWGGLLLFADVWTR